MEDADLKVLAAVHPENGIEDALEFFWLKRHYPVSKKAAFAESFPYLLVFLVILLGGGFVFFSCYFLETSDFTIGVVAKTWVTLSALSFVFYIYYYIRRYVLHKIARYWIQNGCLRFRKGLIKKSFNTFPFAQISEIYLHQTWSQRLFGLSDIVISTPSNMAHRKGYVKSLSVKHANGMRQKILELIAEVDTRQNNYIGSLGEQAKRRKLVDKTQSKRPRRLMSKMA